VRQVINLRACPANSLAYPGPEDYFVITGGNIPRTCLPGSEIGKKAAMNVTHRRLFKLLLLLAGLPTVVQLSLGAIGDVRAMLDTCPQYDAIYPVLRNNFKIYRDFGEGGTILCSEPVSAMPLALYTDELILLQGLRVAYYMDRGQSGHLPWTSGTLYDWMSAHIGGFNLRSDITMDECCDQINGKWIVKLHLADLHLEHHDH
jgi:hypothetical protein